MRPAAKVSLFVMLCAIWGSTWLVIKIGYGGLGPFNVAAIRFLLAGVVLAPIVPLMGARWPRGRAEWLLVLWVGAILFAADYGLIYWGEQFIDSGLTAILFAIMPLLTAFAAHAYLPGERLTARKLGGTTLAFLGIVALFADRVRVDASLLLPMAAIVGSAACAAMASVAAKRHGRDLHPASLNAPAMILGALLLAAASLVFGDGLALPREATTWGAVIYLALAGSVLTFLVYFSLLKSWSATTMSFVAIFTPIVALVLGFLVLDERPTPWTAVGAALVLAGVTLALTRGGGGSRQPRAPRAG